MEQDAGIFTSNSMMKKGFMVVAMQYLGIHPCEHPHIKQQRCIASLVARMEEVHAEHWERSGTKYPTIFNMRNEFRAVVDALESPASAEHLSWIREQAKK
jgi:hypothetical protein